MADVVYRRVSTLVQNTERQDFKNLKADKVFEDKASGSSRKRPELERAIEYLRDGDTLNVYSIDRLARSLIDLESIVKELNNIGVTVKFHKEGFTFAPDESNSMTKLMFQMMGAFAEFERNLINERTAEGRAKAKAKGKHLGRKSALNMTQVSEIREKLSGGAKTTALSNEYGVARNTIYAVKRGQYKVIQ